MSVGDDTRSKDTWIADYLAAGWKLCGIEAGKKCPMYRGWQMTPRDADQLSIYPGVGLLLAHSGLCTLDVDNYELAKPWLAERGVDLDALLNATDAVRFESGRPNRFKLLYRLSRPTTTTKIEMAGNTILEFRCASSTGGSAQDVLPPSVHPVTREPYRWVYGESLLGDWRKPPGLPPKLLAAWREQGGESVLLATPCMPSAEMGVGIGPAPLSDQEPTGATPVRTTPTIPLDELRELLLQFDPNCGHDEWLKVIMALHNATHGSEDGLLLADEWSRKAIRIGSNGKPVYWGLEHIRSRWKSFSRDPGRRLVTDAYLRRRGVARADEFTTTESADARPVVSLNGGELHNYAAQCEQILADEVYVRERQLVRIGGVQDIAPERGGAVQRDEVQAVIIPATPEYLRRRLNELARFSVFRRREKSNVSVDCPKDLAHNIAGQGYWHTFRPLKAIARSPYVRRNGSICETPGYDVESCIFYAPNAEFPIIPTSPTREDAMLALGVLFEPFKEFPFATEAARSAFVAHILTEVVRPAIRTSPVFVITAPTPGTGKTLLSEMPSRIAHGCGPALRPWVDGEEMRKSLFASAFAGDRTIGFDNLPNGTKVRSPILCGFVTAETYSDRKLGASETPAVPNRSVVFMTGNNLTPSGDLARRSIVIRLDADTPSLRDRRFRISDLRGYVAANRPALLVAALEVVLAYLASGAQSGKPPPASFEDWSRFVREPLLWLGMADPVTTQDDETDDEAEPLAEAFRLIAAEFAESEFTASDLAKKCDPLVSGDRPLSAALEATGCGVPTDPTKVGYWLREKRDRIAGGWKLIAGAESRGTGRKWRLRSAP